MKSRKPLGVSTLGFEGFKGLHEPLTSLGPLDRPTLVEELEHVTLVRLIP